MLEQKKQIKPLLQLVIGVTFSIISYFSLSGIIRVLFVIFGVIIIMAAIVRLMNEFRLKKSFESVPYSWHLGMATSTMLIQYRDVKATNNMLNKKRLWEEVIKNQDGFEAHPFEFVMNHAITLRQKLSDMGKYNKDTINFQLIVLAFHMIRINAKNKHDEVDLMDLWSDIVKTIPENY